MVGIWQDISDKKDAELIIQRQAASLTELSTPLIPITKDVVLMPLIGTMDSHRASLVIETLLDGINKSKARFAILDITGVSVVDTQVANSLLKAAKSVRLLGADVILTGIRPDVARTLVELGADMGDLVTCSTLRAGVAHAMRHGR
jgi:rsbT co-antagonist protein RsbR